jgi:guanylate cyclase
MIKITRETYKLIKDEFVCESRGTLEVKGKVEMEVWLIKSAMESMSQAGA